MRPVRARASGLRQTVRAPDSARKARWLTVSVHLHRQAGAVANLICIAVVEDEQPVDRCGRTREIVLREIRGLELRQLAREDLARRERSQVVLAQLDTAAE